MKKLLFVFTILFLLFPLVSAVEFNLNDNYMQGETIIARVSGNFLTSITKDNVFFYQGHVRIPAEYDVSKVNDDYYIYVSLVGKTEGNYSISIQGVKYMSGNQVLENDIVKNFTITNSTASFSIKPGFVVASSGFSLQVQNLQDSQILISANTQAANGSERDISITQPNGVVSKEYSFPLKSGEIKNINFVLGKGYPTFQLVAISSSNLTYEIPVYIYSSDLPGQTTQQQEQEAFSIQPPEIIVSIPTNSVSNRTFFIYNTGNTTLKNISISLSDEISAFVNLSQTVIDNLEPKSNIPIYLNFFSPGETEADGTMKAQTQSGTISYSQISINFLNNYIPTNESTQSYTTKTCAESNGVVCTSTQSCSTDSIYAKDSVCCLGTCNEASSGGSSWTGRIVVIILLVLVGILALWFYFKKFKKAKKPVDLLKIGKK